MTLLKATAAAVLATALLAVTPATASTGDSDWRGNCGFDTLNQESVNNNDWDGIVYADVVPYSPTHNNVVNATVTCVLRINGASVLEASGSGSGAVVFANRLHFTAGVTDIVDVCTRVDFTSDPTPTREQCSVATTTQFPPQYTLDLLSYVLGVTTWGEVTYVDPAFCGASGGDVYLADQLLWDCPPYEEPVPPGPGDSPLMPPPFVPDGAGWNDGDTGFLALTGKGIGATCSFHRDGDTIAVTGAVATTAADSSTLHCVLKDAATGTVFYDATAPAALHDTVPAISGKVTVCTEGSGTWGADTVTVGQYCRPGLPI